MPESNLAFAFYLKNTHHRSLNSVVPGCWLCFVLFWKEEDRVGHLGFKCENRFELCSLRPSSPGSINSECIAAAAAAAAKSLQLCPTLCDPETAAHEAPPSLGFSRQEHWSGLLCIGTHLVPKLVSAAWTHFSSPYYCTNS